jgi:hypothetical protein
VPRKELRDTLARIIGLLRRKTHAEIVPLLPEAVSPG